MANELANGKWQMANAQSPRVAIVCDWLIGGGAEKVVLELHRMYPEAPIYTSYCAPEWREKLDHMVVTGPLQAWPFSRLRKFIPFLRIWWFQSLRFDDYDLVISSSGAEAKGIRTNPGKWQMANGKSDKKRPLHIAYIHAPTHYYWSRYEEYLKRPGFGRLDWLAQFGLRILVGPLRKWDYAAAQRPDYLIANSTHTQAAIKKYYGRGSMVVHPPVDTDHFGEWQIANGKSAQRSGFVIAGRQTPYKRIDLAVAACTRLNLPLTVIGNGPEHAKLVRMAGPSIQFVTDADDGAIARYFQSAEAFIFPGIDDFGIVAVEAMAAGTPVIAYKAGGAQDFINDDTGMFFEEQTVSSLTESLQAFDSARYSSKNIQKVAEKFSAEKFRDNMTQALQDLTSNKLQ